MRRILALLCVRNEAERYLQSSLAWNATWWDELFVFDDQSTDRTPVIASRFGTVTIRSNDEPSFLEHEGRFRSVAWEHFEEALGPTEDDWVFVFDADEFLVANHVRSAMHEVANQASGIGAVGIHVPEVWAADTDHLYMRSDGFWNDNYNPRYCRYSRDWRFNDRAMGCGSTPTYAWDSFLRTDALELVHVGYLDPDERQARYNRYVEHPEGHNPQHVASILEPPTLEGWTGVMPTIWRGER